MIKNKKRIIFILLAIALIVGGVMLIIEFTTRPEEEEALVIVEDLVKASCELNEIYYGKGLNYDDSMIYQSVYRQVDLNEKYKTVDILSARTKEVFTASYANSLIQYHLNPSVGGTGGLTKSRYIEDSTGLIAVYKDYESIEITQYKYDTIKIDSIRSKRIVATIMSTEGEEVEVVIRKETDGWRLDSATV
ncbi:MAG: hypothetical protein IJX51_05755 [Clostridia bacterium]|nr:hypothetical protein [Clostridia bacterium]